MRRVLIPKPDGSQRPLGVTTVLDRVIQQAITQVLTPLYDGNFSQHSYGFRAGRNAHQAVRHVESGRKLKRRHAVRGVGGVVGPALDTIATRKREDYILENLVDPGATIAEGYEGKVSPMPPMGVLLKPQRLADAIA